MSENINLPRNGLLSARQYAKLSYEDQQKYTRSLMDDESSEEELFNFDDYDSEDDPEYVLPVPRKINLDEDTVVAGPSGQQFVPRPIKNKNLAYDEDSDVEREEISIEIVESDSESDYEQEEENVPIDSQCGSFKAKDGTIWNKDPMPPSVQTRAHNVLRQNAKASAAPETKMLGIVDTFRRIFTPQISNIIIRETNRRAERAFPKFNAEVPDDSKRSWTLVTMQEFEAYLAVLLMAGVQRSKKECVEDLWKATSNPLFRASMSIQRFRMINRYIRFDNMDTRAERMKESKAAPILDVWLMLNDNLRKMYRPSANLTVDEQLYP